MLLVGSPLVFPRYEFVGSSTINGVSWSGASSVKQIAPTTFGIKIDCIARLLTLAFRFAFCKRVTFSSVVSFNSFIILFTSFLSVDGRPWRGCLFLCPLIRFVGRSSIWLVRGNAEALLVIATQWVDAKVPFVALDARPWA